jgi:enamine deaminase RidA (YjgF/YER057c/UK114 family)
MTAIAVASAVENVLLRLPSSMNPEAQLAELGLTLPNPPAAAGSYVPVVRTGNLLFCAGTIAVFNGQQTHIGQVGKEQTIETARKAAEICVLNTLANIKAAVGSLDRVTRIVMVNGFVNAVDGFSDSPAVINGASDLLVKVFGEAGKHARAAVATNGLPRGTTVEVVVVAEVR